MVVVSSSAEYITDTVVVVRACNTDVMVVVGVCNGMVVVVVVVFECNTNMVVVVVVRVGSTDMVVVMVRVCKPWWCLSVQHRHGGGVKCATQTWWW